MLKNRFGGDYMNNENKRKREETAISLSAEDATLFVFSPECYSILSEDGSWNDQIYLDLCFRNIDGNAKFVETSTDNHEKPLNYERIEINVTGRDAMGSLISELKSFIVKLESERNRLRANELLQRKMAD